jgi:hypothetical protein
VTTLPIGWNRIRERLEQEQAAGRVTGGRQASFVGVGAMVGAGTFALLGTTSYVQVGH